MCMLFKVNRDFPNVIYVVNHIVLKERDEEV